MTTITLPRAVVEQALEAMERARPLKADYTTPEYFEEAKRKHYAAMAALRAALAQQAEPVEQTCTWQQDGDSDSGVYGTSCGHYFQIEDGTPDDNKMAWCCYCGKKLAQELITENKDD